MKVNAAILLCTYNGAAYLQEQLESYSQQSLNNWSLFVFDDASTDNTKEIVEQFTQRCAGINNVQWLQNKARMGFSRNFFNAIASTPKDFDYYALSDQDDIWQKEKLARAVSFLSNEGHSKPALYCSRTILTDKDGKEIGYSPLFKRPASFSNALVQSIAGGNTMVLNKAAIGLLSKIKPDLDVISHDWFIYQLVSGAGGTVHYDPVPTLLYRQHGNNVIGSNVGIFAKVTRIGKLFAGGYKSWNERNIKALRSCASLNLLTRENMEKLELFSQARKEGLVTRCAKFLKSGIYRQTFEGNLALILGAIINKL
ncbi:MAG: glycosyltransferase family 2 protein [Rickettsiaceae bacterium]